MFIFNRKYFILALLLFIIELVIAIFAHDRIIRPYVGDLLVVILLYCMVKSCLLAPVKITAYAVLLFAYLIETLQYSHIVKLIGLHHYKLANIIIGTSFEWLDMLAYTLGTIIIIALENLKAFTQ